MQKLGHAWDITSGPMEATRRAHESTLQQKDPKPMCFPLYGPWVPDGEKLLGTTRHGVHCLFLLWMFQETVDPIHLFVFVNRSGGDD